MLRARRGESTDEWYTTWPVVDRELSRHMDGLRGMRVYCNCDGPESMFAQWFAMHYTQLGLAGLRLSRFNPGVPGVGRARTSGTPHGRSWTGNCPGTWMGCVACGCIAIAMGRRACSPNGSPCITPNWGWPGCVCHGSTRMRTRCSRPMRAGTRGCGMGPVGCMTGWPATGRSTVWNVCGSPPRRMWCARIRRSACWGSTCR